MVGPPSHSGFLKINGINRTVTFPTLVNFFGTCDLIGGMTVELKIKNAKCKNDPGWKKREAEVRAGSWGYLHTATRRGRGGRIAGGGWSSMAVLRVNPT